MSKYIIVSFFLNCASIGVAMDAPAGRLVISTFSLDNHTQREQSYDCCGGTRKRPNEDRYIMDQSLPGIDIVAAVFDGHGGREVSEHLKQKFVPVLKHSIEELQAENASIDFYEKVFIHTYKLLDEEVKTLRGGATACSLLIKDNIVHIANIGDSRLILIKTDGSVSFATRDHNYQHFFEAERLKQHNVTIKPPYIEFENTGLKIMCSRSIGDHSVDPGKKVLIPQPEYSKISLTEKDLAIIIASDGLWDKMTNEEVAKFVSNPENDRQTIAKIISYNAKKQRKS